MTYKTPAALEMAVKAAAQASPLDTGRAIQDFYFHRLLCRVFAEENDSFVLKGGHGLLARTTGARLTRDIDLLSTGDDLDDALDELLRLSKVDLGDFVSFEFVKAEPIKADDEYRSGLKVRFIPRVGKKRLREMSIDLVVDETSGLKADRISPVDRIEVKGIETCDYLVYPVEAALADKYFGIVELHNGRTSSRVKDLVDILVYALTSDVDGSLLREKLVRESSIRHNRLAETFSVPPEWKGSYASAFAKLCKGTVVPQSLQSLEGAEAFAAKLLNPALDGTSNGMIWNSIRSDWGAVCIIRPMSEDETLLLWDFLYGAIYIPRASEGEVPRSVVHDDPMCRAAVEGFGSLPDDRALVAEVDGTVVGACWVRTTEEYGHIDNKTPSFSISVEKGYRGRGIGGKLMREMLLQLKDSGYARASLSVQKANPALHLYERLGFRIIGDGADDSEWLMTIGL